jgi:hypothetical protein
MALGWTQPLTELSTRNFPGDEGRPALKADSLTTVSRLYRKCWSLDISQPYGSSRPVTGIALPFLSLFVYQNLKCCTKILFISTTESAKTNFRIKFLFYILHISLLHFAALQECWSPLRQMRLILYYSLFTFISSISAFLNHSVPLASVSILTLPLSFSLIALRIKLS